MDSEPLDVVIEGGTVFDGRGTPARVANVGLLGGKVARISAEPLPKGPATQVVDARGRWVMPGFVDMHTHYDAEVELAPSLSESVRHGVTSVVVGSCSLSLAVGTPEDLADMFCRVEAIPYEVVRPLLEEKKTWDTHADYLQHLGELPLGPNVASFVGHSAVRAHVLGIERSLDKSVRPTEPELQKMDALVKDALEQGYLGLSLQTLPWDKMGGSRPFRSRPLPATFARWSERRRLARHVRDTGRVLQGVPNVTTKVNVLLFMLESVGLLRKPLKTTVISMMDTRATRGLHKLIGLMSRVLNTALGANFRWQALPEVFDLWSDGIDLVVFEEFGAGTAALHLQDAMARADLLKSKEYRQRFRREWTSVFLPKVFHRDFNQSEILACPDGALVGRSFTQVAKERGQDVVDTFLDLVAQYGTKLRWYTVMANDRLQELEWIVRHPDVLIGFSDAGAHLRNMAHYNFPLRLLRLAHQAQKAGRDVMSLERAVHRVTGELAEWFGLDAGVLEEGRRADVVVVNPEGLDGSLDRPIDEPMENFNGFVRLVNRNDRAVEAVFIGGKAALSQGALSKELGKRRFGQVLRALSGDELPRA